METIELTVRLDERAYRELQRRAQAEHRRGDDLLGEIVERDLAGKTQTSRDTDDWSKIAARPLEERRALARQACGSWGTAGGETAVEFQRRLRTEWDERAARLGLGPTRSDAAADEH